MHSLLAQSHTVDTIEERLDAGPTVLNVACVLVASYAGQHHCKEEKIQGIKRLSKRVPAFNIKPKPYQGEV